MSFPSVVLPGPSPQEAPVPVHPIQKAQIPKKSENKDDQDDADAVVKHLSQKEEEEAEFDYMNDVESRQRKLVEKHQKAKLKEEDGDDEKDDDDEKKPSLAPTVAPKLVE